MALDSYALPLLLIVAPYRDPGVWPLLPPSPKEGPKSRVKREKDCQRRGIRSAYILGNGKISGA